jgi:putative transcriptional regulator
MKLIRPGDFLLATSALDGSYFHGSVVFIVESSSVAGSWGLVINNSAHIPLDEVFRKNQKIASGAFSKELAWVERKPYTFFFGGPVQGTDPFQKLSVCVLEIESSVFNGASEVSKGVFISRIPLDMELPVSRLIAPNNKTARMFFGYCGWGVEQLENEILDGAWEISSPVPFDVFSKDKDEAPITVNKFRECYESHRA